MGALYNLNPSPAPQQQQPPLSRNANLPVSVSVTTTAAIGLAANANRAKWQMYNAGPGTILMREGTTVAANLYEKLIPPNFHWDSEPSNYRYTGAISFMTVSGTATVMVSESVV